MATSLQESVRRVFEGSPARMASLQYSSSRTGGNRLYMEIPLNASRIEIPVMAYPAFLRCIESLPCAEALAVELFSKDYMSRYTTVERYMRDVLISDFSEDRLIRCLCTQEGRSFTYYGSHGAVFDESFRPLMMCSWQVAHEQDSPYGAHRYSFIRPILRIDPDVYLCQSNPMEKWIVRKMLGTALTLRAFTRPDIPIQELQSSDFSLKDIKVEIDRCPFSLRSITPPPMDVTDKDLLMEVIEHVGEVAQ